MAKACRALHKLSGKSVQFLNPKPNFMSRVEETGGGGAYSPTKA